MIADPIISHRVTPRHGSFRLEAVTATGAIEVLAIYPTEREALEELRVFQLAAERAEAATLAMEDGPRGPRGKLILTPDAHNPAAQRATAATEGGERPHAA